MEDIDHEHQVQGGFGKAWILDLPPNGLDVVDALSLAPKRQPVESLAVDIVRVDLALGADPVGESQGHAAAAGSASRRGIRPPGPAVLEARPTEANPRRGIGAGPEGLSSFSSSRKGAASK